MSLAALCLGIVSIAFAAIVTAPFFWIVALAGLPIAVMGLVVSLVAFVDLLRRRRARAPIEPGSFSHAAWGLSLCVIAIVWQAGWFLAWREMTM